MIKLESAFWHRVENNIPPPVDSSASASNALRKLYPHDNNQTLDLSEDLEANRLFSKLIEVRDQLNHLSDKEALLKNQLQEKIGDNSIALFAEGKISWRQSKPSTVLDTTRLKKEQPELVQQFSKVRQGSRRFLVQHN